MLNVYKNQQNWQTGSRNLMGSKTLPTIWGTYMKLVTKYQISAINSCWEKCAYIINVYKDQLSRQTGSRNLTGPKPLPTIWYTYMMLVTKYQISAIHSYWEKCDEKYLGWTDRGKTVSIPPSPFVKINIIFFLNLVFGQVQWKKLRQRLSLSGKQDVACYIVLRIPPLVHCKSHGKQEVDVQ
jgi:hypothetical protein